MVLVSAYFSMCLFAQSCLTLWDSLDCSLPGSSIHGIFQARILKWVAIFYSKGLSQPRDQTCISCVSCIEGRFFTHWAIRKALLSIYSIIYSGKLKKCFILSHLKQNSKDYIHGHIDKKKSSLSFTVFT